MASLGHILFICGSLEPGRDGVGDYTRMLAVQLSRLDCSSKIVALYDKEVREVTPGPQVADGIDVATLRIPKGANDQERFKVLKTEIASTQPSWVSLQFVPYSFDKRGIPTGLPKNLAGLRTSAKFHIMFHELWIKPQSVFDVKSIIIERLQRHIIFKLIEQLKPVIITTHLPLYQQRLQNRRVSILPLFGNITIDTELVGHEVTDSLRVISFGSSPSPEEFDQLAFGVKQIARKLGKAVEFRFLGYGGKHKAAVLPLARVAFGTSRVTDVGPLDESELGQEFRAADLGLAKNSGDTLGKSGSAVAMLEHGLPLLVAGGRPDVPSVAPYFVARVWYVDEVDRLRSLDPVVPKSVASLVAQQFLELLSGATVQREVPSL